jgi:hypothetical protein
MTYLIFKKSPRELRERMAEAPRTFVGKVDAYARDIEEADQYQRSHGRDNPNRKGVLIDDGGKAEKELRDRTLRSMGLNPEAYE